jgi:hypothetical protein
MLDRQKVLLQGRSLEDIMNEHETIIPGISLMEAKAHDHPAIPLPGLAHKRYSGTLLESYNFAQGT